MLKTILYIWILILMCTAPLWAQGEPAGAIVDFKGDVWVHGADGKPERSVFRNLPLHSGDTINTGTGGWAAVLMADETLVQVGSDTVFQLRKVARSAGWFELRKVKEVLDTLRRSSYGLKSGRLWLRNNNRDFSLNIETPTVSAGIRGTEVAIRVDPIKTVYITVASGNVDVWNEKERVRAGVNEQITAVPGLPIHKTLLLTPRDAVQWTVSLPPFLGDEFSRDLLPELAQAYGMILRKELREAFELLERLIVRRPDDTDLFCLYGLVALLRGDKEAARDAVEKAGALSPDSVFAGMVQSLVYRSLFRIDDAVAAMERVLLAEPRNSDALIALARLKFGQGRLEEAFEITEKALGLSPDNPEILTLRGFIFLALQNTEEGMNSFEKSVRISPLNGESHMGLAVALMRKGRVGDALEEIAKASLLDPQRSLFLSYMGKMLYQIGRFERALEVLEHASRIDPRDPTPFLYRAIIHYDMNSPSRALNFLNRAIALNDNRAVYRSRFLLDRDMAVKGVDQSIIYNELGLGHWAKSKALDSVKIDYGNASAHAFLAGAYNSMEGRARAGSSELLLSLLMMPASVNALNTYEQYTSFFEKPDLNGVLSGYLGSLESGGNLIVTGNLPRSNLSFNSITSYADSDGWRDTDFRRTKGGHGVVKWDPTPKDAFLLDTAYTVLEAGDLSDARYARDAPVHGDDRSENRTGYVNLGYRRNLGHESDLFLTYRYQDTRQELFTRSLFFLDAEGSLLVDEYHDSDADLPYQQVQVHSFTRIADHRLIAGGVHLWRDKAARISYLDDFYGYIDGEYYYLDSVSETYRNSLSDNYQSIYLQDIWNISGELTLEAALYYDRIKRSNLFSLQTWHEQEISPRAGLVWKPTKADTIRLAGFSYLVPPVFQRIDPPDIAGIPVYRNAVEGTDAEEGDLVWEHEWDKGFFSVNLFTASSSVKEKLVDGSFETWKSSLTGVETVWNQIIGEGLGFSWKLRFRDIDNENAPEKDRREYMATAALKYQHSSGIFAGCAQMFRFDEFMRREKKGGDIWITDFSFGYKFPRKRGQFRFDVRNLFDNHFNWIVDDFMFTGGRVPVREVTANLAFYF